MIVNCGIPYNIYVIHLPIVIAIFFVWKVYTIITPQSKLKVTFSAWRCRIGKVRESCRPITNQLCSVSIIYIFVRRTMQTEQAHNTSITIICRLHEMWETKSTVCATRSSVVHGPEVVYGTKGNEKTDLESATAHGISYLKSQSSQTFKCYVRFTIIMYVITNVYICFIILNLWDFECFIGKCLQGQPWKKVHNILKL